MFWNTNLIGKSREEIAAYMKTPEGRKNPPFRMIDFSNVGTGRVAWEILYFLQNSVEHDWDKLETYLKFYYDELVRSVRA